MPVRYTSDLAEHHAVRTAAGLFDISHMAEFTVTGPGSGAYLDFALSGRLSTTPVGKAKYSLLLAPDGGIVDDLIVYRLAADDFLVIANAGNRAPVAAALRERAAGATEVAVDDCSDRLALLALQGPRAQAILETTAGITGLAVALRDLPYYAAAPARFGGGRILIARTGYTGEDGFELLVDAAAGPALWDALLAAGGPLGIVPAGLAARDTLRLEAGMPLYGHELSLDVAPAQAGLARAVAPEKADFVGRAGLAARPDDAPVLVGLAAAGRRAGRAGYAVLGPDGVAIGVVTSGALSPTLGHPIAMAYVPPALAVPGTELGIDVRGTVVPATVTPLPFYRRKK